MLSGSKRTAAIVFAALLAGLVVLIAATSGIGKPSLPSDDLVAFVDEAPDGEVTQEDLDSSIERVAGAQNLPRPPEPGTPQYDQLQESALAQVLIERWLRGEAAERGIEASEREVDQELESVIQNLGGQRQFEQILTQQNLTEEEARGIVELQVLQRRLQEEVVGTEPPDIPDEEIDEYYDENVEQFQTPETRDVRTILTQDEAEAQEAYDQLADDDSPASWKQVAKEFSTDEATASLGGLRQGVAQGQSEPQLDEAIFSAPEGELVGPIQTDAGYYVLQVEAINEASTQELDEATRGQIEQTLASERQQETATEFQNDFLERWRALTVCADDYVFERCSNAPAPPDPCQGDDDGEEPAVDPATGEPTEGCPAFVTSTQPVPPDMAGDPDATGKPQGPQGLAPPVPALPPGTQTIPGVPQGTAPPGTAPPGTTAPAP
jgi:parvulin-like peptidyl-prolyl isomerase